MLEIYLIAFTTFFATVGPVDVAALYGALSIKSTLEERRFMARKGVLIASGILLFFALFGPSVLTYFGISMSALKTAGGVLLMLMAIEMVFARTSGGTSTTYEENVEAQARQDISVFPLATPLLAGPGAIGACVLLVGQAEGDLIHIVAVIGALLSVMALAYVLLLLSSEVQKFLGVTGLHVISRVVGVLLCALAVQFIFDGIKASGLF